MEQNGTLNELPCKDPAVKLYTLDEKTASFVYTWHKNLEIMLIEKGKLIVQKGNETYELNCKDLIIFDIDSTYSIRSRHPFKALILQFSKECLKSIIPEIDNLRFFTPAKADIKKQITEKLEALKYYTRPDVVQGNQILFNIRLYELIYICYRQCTTTQKGSLTESKIKGHAKLQKAVDYIDKNFVNQIDLKTLASMTGVQTNYFCRLFKRCYGITTLEYIYNLRFSKISQELINTTMPIGTIMKNSGFSNWKLFSKLFKQRFSITAGTFRKKYKIRTDRIEDERQDNKNLRTH